MAKLRILVCWLILLSAGSAAAAPVPVFSIDGPIGPATAEYVTNGLEEAAAAGTPLVILRLDTPGGLDTAMRDIVRAILASPVPVVSWVGPSGARAASAGTYILYASHIAAMAPGTNLGAATPVQIGGMPGSPGDAGDGDDEGAGGKDEPAAPATGGDAMTRKIVNDAVAYLRSLAQLRDRNVEWAERAVREGASLPAAEAIERNVVDLGADSLPALLAAVDGRRVQLEGEARTLQTEGLVPQAQEPGWRIELLSVITNPNVAYLLMLLGIYGLIFELASPGAILPGVIGGISLLLALFAFQALPINYAGLALIGLGIAFMLSEALMPSFGALGLGGVVAFAIGSLLLFEGEGEGFRLSLALVGGVTAASLLILLGPATLAMKAWRRPVVSGAQQMIGAPGIVMEPVDASAGWVHAHGERWRARSDRPLPAGTHVIIQAMDGLTLKVVPENETVKDKGSHGE